MSDFDPDKFMNEPIYAMDFQWMIGDVEDLLDFSESNIELQYRRELQSIRRREEREDLPPGYREHLEENVRHRFEISLPLNVRYGAVLALTTTVEWSVLSFVKLFKEQISKAPGGCNKTVHALSELKDRTGVGSAELIEDYKALVYVRNCIAHNSGITEGYKYEDDIEKSVNRLAGFSLGNWHFFGKHVCITRGALPPYVEMMHEFIIECHKVTNEQGLLHHHRSA